MNNEIDIVKLSPEQWREFKVIRLRALQNDPQAFGSSYSREIAYPDEKWQERVTSAFEGKSDWMVFAKNNKGLIGMVGAWQSEEDKQNNRANIFGVYVAPEDRGKGISKRLMQSLLDELSRNHQISKLKLSVNKDQLAAVKLYEGFGFKIVGQENIQLGDGKHHDEYLMEKDLLTGTP